jgi:uncharacterized protein YndB with AHSA1/START domain
MSNTSTAVVDKLVVRRMIAAPAKDLFDAWLDAKAMAIWMKPGDTAHSDVTVDARVGGRFEIVMHTSNGAIPHRGVYEVIDRPRRLVFTWNSPYAGEHDSLVTVDFLAKAGGTEVVVTHEKLPTEVAVGQHREGWTGCLEQFVRWASARH